ncbi:MAG: type I restriction enzyme S subunit [Paraglaciecola sp.]|jgi:type I restriction enzyme S subunit
MGSDWKSYTLESLASTDKSSMSTGPFGSAISSKYFQEAGVPVIRGGNLSANTSERMSDDGLVFISEEKAGEFKRSTVKSGDLIFTCWGTINQVGLISNDLKYTDYVISNKQMKITLDKSKADPLFLYYMFSGPLKQAEILRNAIGAAVPGFNLGQLKEHLVVLPSLLEQKKISKFINGFDKKIELNRQTNQTLEQMAQTLFKSWFVDFDPVFDNLLAKVDFKLENLASDFPVELLKKAQQRLHALQERVLQQRTSLPKGNKDAALLESSELHALLAGSQNNNHSHFPCEFEFSEPLGWIPKGWALSNVGCISDKVFSGGTPNTRIPEYWGGDLKWFSSGETRNNLIIDTEKRITAEGVANSSTKLSIPGDIFIAGAGQGHTRGQTSLNTVETYFNQSVVCIRVNDKRYSNWLFENLFARYEEMRGLSDSHSIRGSLTTKLVSGMKVLLPSNELICVFDEYAKNLFVKNKLLLEEISTLTKLRDTLLPKLISGELQIPDVKASL